MIALARIDDRLIHGQVTVGWAGHLKPDRIVLVNDEVAADEFENELYRAAVPPGIELSILSVSDALRGFEKLRGSDEKVILLVGSPRDMLRLVEGGARVDEVNLGGLHFEEGKRKLLPYLYVNGEDENDLRELIRRGVHLYCCDVPGNEKVELKDIL